MSFSSDGLQPESKEDIYNTLNKNAITNLREATGNPTASVDTSNESFIGRVNDKLSGRLSDLWFEADQIQKNMYIETASGSALERLAKLVGFTREPATHSRGDLLLTGDDGTIIPEGSIFANLLGDEFVTKSPSVISANNCLSIHIQVGLVDSTTQRKYEVYINQNIYEYLSTTSDDENDILTGLQQAIQLNDLVTSSVIKDTKDPSNSYLQIKLKDTTATLVNIVVNPLLVTNNVTVLEVIEAKETGHIFGDAGSITEIITTIAGLDSVVNPKDFVIGNTKETDDELRIRMKTEFNTVGSGTLSTITAILLKNQDVFKVVINENRLLSTSTDGLPPKTYQAIIKHSNLDSEIAKIIWDTKPLGIDTFGDITVAVNDASGNPQNIRYTKAQDMYAYFRVNYTTFSEEELPKDVRTLISESCTLYGQDTSDIGLDIIPKKFYGVIYNNTTGIDDLDVDIFVSSNPNLNMDNIIGWSNDKIAITQKQIASFATSRFKFIPPAPTN